MISRYFSLITPQQAPTPGARHSSGLVVRVAAKNTQLRNLGRYIASNTPTTIVVKLLCQLPKRFARSHGTRPSERTGAGRAGLNWKTVTSLIRLSSTSDKHGWRAREASRAGSRARSRGATDETYPNDRRGGSEHATKPSGRTAVSRACQRSLIAARALYQFMNSDVAREVVRYTAMMIAMHSTARPVWLSAVFEIDTTSG